MLVFASAPGYAIVHRFIKYLTFRELYHFYWMLRTYFVCMNIFESYFLTRIAVFLAFLFDLGIQLPFLLHSATGHRLFIVYFY